MNFAIYARKSVFSDSSDSIQVQINLCKEYIKCQYSKENVDIIVYGEDEGYSGANTNRPSYQKMISDIENQRIDVVVCYKIDRISRNVKDFSNVFDFMQSHNVSFVSVKEQIDTTTPLGRAMMYICSVFAQMERETIADRIKDSSLALARSGKWAGGKAPIGYSRERQMDGKEHTILVPNKEEVAYLTYIFDTFLDGNYSLNGLETKFKNESFKTLNGYYLSSSQIYDILRSPYIVQNTVEVWDYYHSKGCQMATERKDFDGSHGVMAYGRTSGSRSKKHVLNEPDKWVVMSGLHEPVMDAKKWLAVQSRFGLNKINKTRKYEIGILKGIVKCTCGYKMRVKRKIDKKTGKIYDSYFCQNRDRRGIEFCDMKTVPLEILDNAIYSIIEKIVLDKNVIKNFSPAKKEPIITRSSADINKSIKSLEIKIQKLTSNLSENSSSTAAKYIISEIESLDSQIIRLQSELRELNFFQNDMKIQSENYDTIHLKFCSLKNNFDTLTYSEKNNLLKDLIRKCVWDGDTLHVEL